VFLKQRVYFFHAVDSVGRVLAEQGMQSRALFSVAMTDSAAVRAVGLEKSFGRRPAVRGVDFTLRGAECLALFGPNGAGKTTLLRLIAGLLKPNAGSAMLRDVNVRSDHRARAAVGLVSHQSMLYPALTAVENVEFAARLAGVLSPNTAARAALASLQLSDSADITVRKLSRGQQQRVSVARALVHDPAVLLLDEPYSGLDEGGSQALTSLLQSLRGKGATMILVTHNVAEGLALSTQAAVMIDGKFARMDARPSSGFDVAAFGASYRALAGAHHG
jgi:heme exporter protein A